IQYARSSGPLSTPSFQARAWRPVLFLAPAPRADSQAPMRERVGKPVLKGPLYSLSAGCRFLAIHHPAVSPCSGFVSRLSTARQNDVACGDFDEPSSLRTSCPTTAMSSRSAHLLLGLRSRSALWLGCSGMNGR